MSKTCPPSPASSRSSRTSPLGIPSVDAPWNVVRIDPGGVLTSLEIAPGRSYTIGRRATSDLVVDHDTVSREQALVVGRMSGLPPTLEDLGSRNGTRVGGRVLEPGERFELHHGSTIEIGLTTLLVHHGAVASESLGPASSVRSAPTHERHDERAQSGTLPEGLVIEDPQMRELYRVIANVAASKISVLVLGETGVGKEFLARSVHTLSPRHKRPFVHLNSAALPDSLIESELFGYERGSFSGANRVKTGLFEAADGGTLFLDEVGELSPATQAKLLRTIETGEILPVGSCKARRVDVRLVAATNRDLKSLTTSGQFRHDLYFRLNGISVTVPPLRQRQGEIPRLIEHFARAYAHALGRATPRFADDAIRCLLAYAWPGNVRELRNVIERATLLAEGAVVTAALLDLDRESEEIPATLSSAEPVSVRSGITAPLAGHERIRNTQDIEELRKELTRRERQKIMDALTEAQGNQAEAAKLLGISRRTLLNRLDEYELPRPRKGNRVTLRGICT